jgi:hypothetical protein
MGKGEIFHDVPFTYTDPKSGREIRRLTDFWATLIISTLPIPAGSITTVLWSSARIVATSPTFIDQLTGEKIDGI